MRLLDLFCSAGGAAMGYFRAGFTEIVGIDIKPQPRYPFTFIQGDALAPPVRLSYFDAIHASPPCQKYSWSAKRWKNIERLDLIEPTRTILRESGKPFIIENVREAPLVDPILLCGEMFGLKVLRHRLFECNPAVPRLVHYRHWGGVKTGHYVTVAGHGGDNIKGNGSRKHKQSAMGIDWMTDEELNEAIPPAYTEWIGRQLIEAISLRVSN